MKSLNSTFSGESTIKFDKNCYVDNIKVIELSEKCAIMLANEFNQDGVSSIAIFIGLKWGGEPTPFEFRK